MDEAELAPYLKALGSDDPFGNLIRLVIDFKKSGGTQEQAQELIHSVRVNTGSYEAEDDRDELLCEVLDHVTGWCNSTYHIFAEDFDERHFFRPLPHSPQGL